MKVYILMENGYECSRVHTVFKDKKSAEFWKKSLEDDLWNPPEFNLIVGYSIVEKELV